MKNKSIKVSLKDVGLPNHRLMFSTGNRKVECPIFSVNSGRRCSERAKCPYNRANSKKTGAPWCYAQKMEAFRPNIATSREANASAIRAISKLDHFEYRLAAVALATRMIQVCNRANVWYVRFNESGDLDEVNVHFLASVTRKLLLQGIKPFTYSRAPLQLRGILSRAGCVVLKSDDDFVVVEDAEEAGSRGIVLCPGIGCGKTCLRCPRGLRTAIIRH